MRRSWLEEGATEGWIAHRLVLLLSPSWRHRPVPLIRVLERIEIEHLRHGGAENGNLTVAYDQFVSFGVSRRVVAPALQCGVQLGLLEVRQSHELARNIRSPNLYRLTYVPEKTRRAPTDEWAGVSEDLARQIGEQFQVEQTKTRSEKSGSQFPFQQTSSSPSRNLEGPSSSPSRNSPVPHGKHTLISGGDTPEVAQGGAEEAPVHTGRARRSDEPAGGMPHVSSSLNRILQREAS